MLNRFFNKASTNLTSKQSFGFARYYNKAQTAALGMKEDMMSYEYVPDAINNLMPIPRYPTKSVNANNELMRDNKYNLERKRTSLITKRQNEAKYF